MVLLSGGEPDPVVCSLIALVPQYENNLVLNVYGKTAEHRPRQRRQRSNRVEHELMWNGLALRAAEKGSLQLVLDGIVPTLRHQS